MAWAQQAKDHVAGFAGQGLQLAMATYIYLQSLWLVICEHRASERAKRARAPCEAMAQRCQHDRYGSLARVIRRS